MGLVVVGLWLYKSIETLREYSNKKDKSQQIVWREAV
jgi:hypothetical protein